jgi:hypothetical protein
MNIKDLANNIYLRKLYTQVTMRFAYSIKQKLRIAILLFFIMACSILIRILEDKSVNKMNASFISLYNDRLVPAMDLYHVVENVNARKELLESVIYSNAKVPQENLKSKLIAYNANIDSLIRKYEQTYLVQQEKKDLIRLKQSLQEILSMEQKLVNYMHNEDAEMVLIFYETSGKQIFLNTTNHLSSLIDTQTKVGNDIIKQTEQIVSGTKIYSNLQLALAILIGVLIVGILFTSNVVNIRNDNFTLN